MMTRCRSSDGAPAGELAREGKRQAHQPLHLGAGVGGVVEAVALQPLDHGVAGLAQAHRARGDGIEHRLQLGRRLGDDPQDSAVAVWLVERLAQSRLRAWISWNRRTFSMAMTAWSAKVWSSAICVSVNGRTSSRRSRITPTASPSRSSGTASVVRWPPYGVRAGRTGTPSASARGRATWTGPAVDDRAAGDRPAADQGSDSPLAAGIGKRSRDAADQAEPSPRPSRRSRRLASQSAPRSARSRRTPAGGRWASSR